MQLPVSARVFSLINEEEIVDVKESEETVLKNVDGGKVDIRQC